MGNVITCILIAGVSFAAGTVVGASMILNLPLETIAGHKEDIKRAREKARQQREYSYQKSY